jgi:hypothetical protein
MIKKMTSILLTLNCLFFTAASAQGDADFEIESDCDADSIRGKVDIGAAYIHVDVLQSGKTVGKMDMAGVKADLYYRIWSGLVLKPAILYGYEDKNNHLVTGGLGIGFCLPYKETCVTPIVGCNGGYLRTDLDIKAGPMTFTFEQRYKTVSPFVGVEASYNFCPTWRIVGAYQYTWNFSRVTVKDPMFGNKSSSMHSEGSSYSAMIEHDFNDCWSINAGGTYNNSLTKEKHGLRGYGFKAGIAYWF